MWSEITRSGVVPGGGERHLDDAVEVAIRRRQTADVQTEAVCNRRADLVGNEYLSLDLARLHDIFGERAQRGFAANLETQGLHAAEQFSLDVACAREVLGKSGRILLEPRPFRALPYILRIGKTIPAYFAEIEALFSPTVQRRLHECPGWGSTRRAQNHCLMSILIVYF